VNLDCCAVSQTMPISRSQLLVTQISGFSQGDCGIQ
jgi:hypothetical protein